MEQAQVLPRPKSEPAAPGLTVALYILGVLCFPAGLLIMAIAGDSSGSDRAEGFGLAVAAFLSSPFLFGFGYALRKLQQIEFHLRPK